MNWKLFMLISIGLVLVFVSLSEGQTCYRTTYTRATYSNCVRRWFRRRCSTAYTTSSVRKCCSGYSGSSCKDNNECLVSNRCRSPQYCENTPGSYKCVCKTGFKVSGTSCVDVNECTSGTHRCSRSSGICTNTHGSYKCSCKTGYRLDPDKTTCRDINECLTSSHGCSHGCVNTDGSYKCTCNPGYTLSSDGRTCKDINECAVSTLNACNQKCTNTAGSYTCSCYTGFSFLSGSRTTCQGKTVTKTCYRRESSAKYTYYGCGFLWLSRCKRISGYTSRTITYLCNECAPGYTGTNCATATCTGTNTCLNGGSCVGPNTCACRSGYTLPNCINVCSNHECAHTCAPSGSSYVCRCNPGYILNSDQRTCRADNPCQTNNGGCNHYCRQTSPGRHYCSCRSGYTLQYDSRTCTDTNECLRLPCDHTCTNTAGSYTCACQSGYTASSNGARCTAQNIDNLSPFFLFTDTTAKKIYKMDYKTEAYSVIPFTSLDNPIAIDMDPKTGLIFWTDVGNKRIYSGLIDGSNQRVVRQLPYRSIPDGLTLLADQRLVFYTDTGRDVVARMDFDGANHKDTITTGLMEPRAIVVDNDTNLMFWTDWGVNPKIESSRFDGSGRKTLVNTGLSWPNGLVLDKIDSRLYWVDAGQQKMEYINLDGSGRTAVYGTTNGHFFDVVKMGPRLYYSDWRRNGIRYVESDGRNPGKFGPDVFGRINGMYIYDDRKHDDQGSVGGTNVCRVGEMCADFDVEGSSQAQLEGVTVVSAASGKTTADCSRQSVFKVTFNKLSRGASSPLCHSGVYGPRQLLKVDMFFSNKSRSGWTFNIGDSVSNNGYGGDSGHSDFANELQGYGTRVTSYASTFEDSISTDCRAQTLWSDMIGYDVNHVTFYIANNYFLMITDKGERKELCHKCLFGLDGRKDRRAGGGEADTDIYIATNRVVQTSSTRTGYGLCSLKLSWVEAVPTTTTTTKSTTPTPTSTTTTRRVPIGGDGGSTGGDGSGSTGGDGSGTTGGDGSGTTGGDGSGTTGGDGSGTTGDDGSGTTGGDGSGTTGGDGSGTTGGDGGTTGGDGGTTGGDGGTTGGDGTTGGEGGTTGGDGGSTGGDGSGSTGGDGSGTTGGDDGSTGGDGGGSTGGDGSGTTGGDGGTTGGDGGTTGGDGGTTGGDGTTGGEGGTTGGSGTTGGDGSGSTGGDGSGSTGGDGGGSTGGDGSGTTGGDGSGTTGGDGSGTTGGDDGSTGGDGGGSTGGDGSGTTGGDDGSTGGDGSGTTGGDGGSTGGDGSGTTGGDGSGTTGGDGGSTGGDGSGTTGGDGSGTTGGDGGSTGGDGDSTGGDGGGSTGGGGSGTTGGDGGSTGGDGDSTGGDGSGTTGGDGGSTGGDGDSTGGDGGGSTGGDGSGTTGGDGSGTTGGDGSGTTGGDGGGSTGGDGSGTTGGDGGSTSGDGSGTTGGDGGLTSGDGSGTTGGDGSGTTGGDGGSTGGDGSGTTGGDGSGTTGGDGSGTTGGDGSGTTGGDGSGTTGGDGSGTTGGDGSGTTGGDGGGTTGGDGGSTGGGSDDDPNGDSNGEPTEYFTCSIKTCSKGLLDSAMDVPESDCANYCRCMEETVSGVTQYVMRELTCGAGHVWNHNSRFCDLEENYECESEMTPGTGRCIGSCTGPSELNMLTGKNNTDCAQFCQCVKNPDDTYGWQTIYCPHGFMWKTDEKRCRPSYSMECLVNGTGIHDPESEAEEDADDGSEDYRCPAEFCLETQTTSLMLVPYSNCSMFCQCVPKETLPDGSIRYGWKAKHCAKEAYWNRRTRNCGSFEQHECLETGTIEEEDLSVEIYDHYNGPKVFNCSGICSDAFHGDITSQLGSNCTQYCQCVAKTNSPSYEWMPMYCAPGTLFDSASKLCRHDEDVQCKENGIGVYTEPDGEVEDDEADSPDNEDCPLEGCTSMTSGNVFMVADTNCNEYCRCLPYDTDSDGKSVYRWVTQNCPTGKAFNVTSAKCEAYSTNVCPEDSSGNQDHCEGSCSQTEWGKLNKSMDADCRSFCQCSPLNNDPAFYWQVLNCGTNTRFSPRDNTCVHENNVNCSGPAKTITEGRCPVDECIFKQNYNLLVLPGSDCRKFCQCAPLKLHLNGTVEYTWVVKDCALGTRWNNVTGNCGHFDENTYVCPDSGSPSSGGGSSGAGSLNQGCPATCPREDLGKFKAAEDNSCSSYCQCAPAHNGGYYWQKMYCADGTLFDKDKKECLFEANVQCQTQS